MFFYTALKQLFLKQTLYYSILGLLILVIYTVFNISLAHFTKESFCPIIINLPVCYIILTAFTTVAITHIFHLRIHVKYYYFFISTPLLFALFGSILELLNKNTCPKNEAGIPMCFISLGICLLLITLKYFNSKVTS